MTALGTCQACGKLVRIRTRTGKVVFHGLGKKTCRGSNSRNAERVRAADEAASKRFEDRRDRLLRGAS